MGLSKCKLAELIELVTETNSELKYKADDVRGMTITKEIIPTKANVKDIDLSKFLVVHPHEFIFNPRTHGKKIGFGYNNSEDTFLISWNNIAFRVSSKAKGRVLAKYLFLHFNRSEWDREACFRSWGSSTEVFSWDALCEMEVDLPPIDIQRKYVAVYNAMLANQQSYERGLEDLRLTCETLIDDYKQALSILSQMNESRESFRKIGLTFEEKAFYDILVSLRDQYNFEYGTDKEIDGVIVNDRCRELAKKVKEIIDTKSSFSDWLNNQNVRNQLKLDIKICLVKNGYPPQYSPEVFSKVMEQVENFEENSDMPVATTYAFP